MGRDLFIAIVGSIVADAMPDRLFANAGHASVLQVCHEGARSPRHFALDMARRGIISIRLRSGVADGSKQYSPCWSPQALKRVLIPNTVSAPPSTRTPSSFMTLAIEFNTFDFVS
jgi:hypothetical protein